MKVVTSVWTVLLAAVLLLPAMASAQNYVAYLSGAQEVPPNASPATGVGYFTLNATQDTLYYSITWSGLLCNQTAAHIHRGVAGVSGAVVHPLQNLVVNSSSGAWPLSAQNVIQLQSDSLYVNVHSSCYPAGEIRGQIGDALLPVEFGSFSAVGGLSDIKLFWNTRSEQNNREFEIRREGMLKATVPTLGNGAAGHDYSWVDNSVESGVVYRYTLTAVDLNGTREELASTNGSTNPDAGMVREFTLHQNYPNPFNPSTTIVFDLAQNSHVTLTVYNVLMQRVGTVLDGDLNSGAHSISFNASDLTSGLYFYELRAGAFRESRKMLLMK